VDDICLVYGQVPKGEYVKLTISDTGCGIPDEIIQKIFDPFFTTKAADKKRGSGLGMSVVDAVIKDHNGYIDMATKVGQGTSFFIYLPVCRETSGIVDTNLIPGGHEKILVIDDDEIQRKVSEQLLTKLGYKVLTAESGERAIEILTIDPHDLLVLDMIMPSGIDGTETYRRVLEINPSQKAILVSGFSESNRVFEAQRLGVGAFVKKPLTKNSLAAAVRTELDRKFNTVIA
jgi:two-component system cell cycle sensor histidine kinase/response regulator CckA